MSYGSTAYESYVRIHTELGLRKFPTWDGLTHERRMAWEAAAQAVALAVLPGSHVGDLHDDPLEEEFMEVDSLHHDADFHRLAVTAGSVH